MHHCRQEQTASENAIRSINGGTQPTRDCHIFNHLSLMSHPFFRNYRTNLPTSLSLLIRLNQSVLHLRTRCGLGTVRVKVITFRRIFKDDVNGTKRNQNMFLFSGILTTSQDKSSSVVIPLTIQLKTVLPRKFPLNKAENSTWALTSRLRLHSRCRNTHYLSARMLTGFPFSHK